MKPTPLKILLVSRNQAMLAALSKFLDLLGVVAIQVVDPRQATAAAASELPEILILDAELLPNGGRELCRAVCGGGMRNHVFTLLLVDEPARLDEMVEALKLGVDDFLAKPIVFGELLARLARPPGDWSTSGACRPTSARTRSSACPRPPRSCKRCAWRSTSRAGRHPWLASRSIWIFSID